MASIAATTLSTELKPHLLDFPRERLENTLLELGHPLYRLKQVFDWVFRQRASDFAQMTNVPAAVRDALAQRFALRKLKVVRKESSHLDPTVKFSFQAREDTCFSAVFLPHVGYHSLCISTQVGCAWRCRFCASGLVPYERNLTAGEILDQIFRAEEGTGKRIQNVLFMGMGEPLANYEGTVQTIRWLTAPDGFALNPKRITVSTTGVAPMIKKLAGEKLNVNLALSLHAPDDELRRRIMPVSSKFAIKDVMAACKQYVQSNSGDFTIEYILLRDVNDRPEHAHQLHMLLSNSRLQNRPKVNLIPYNPVPGLPFKAPSAEHVQKFFEYFKGKDYIVHSRKPQGQDIGAACGQLG